MAPPYFSFPAPSISSLGNESASMGNESLSTEPPGSDLPLLPSAQTNGADTDDQSKDGNPTVTVLPADEPETGRRGIIAKAAEYFRPLNPARLTTWAFEKWGSYFLQKREVPKVVIHKGINAEWFAHTWVHLPPIIATAVVLGFNLWLYPNARIRGHYIGGTIPGPLEDEAMLNWLQFAAKLHEITIVAGLSTIVWDMVRYFLVYKPLGVPLGLIGAGGAFTEAKFLLYDVS